LSPAAHTLQAPPAWRAWLSAARPATLTLCVSPVLVATAIAHHEGIAHPAAALSALLGAAAIQIGTNLHNDAADFERGADTSQRVGPARATQRGWLSPRDVRAGATLSFALAAAFGAYLVWTAGWPLILVGVASIACALSYTGGPYPLAYVGLGDLFVFLFFGVVATCGAYYCQTLELSWPVVAASLPLGFLATGVLVVNNLRDREGDASAGKLTLAVRFGPAVARGEYVVCLALAFATPLVAWTAGVVHPGWLLPLLALPLGIAQAKHLLTLDGAALNPHLGATARLQLVYALLLTLGVNL
jgi:1,4-dihydroxy-2-naphthoate octaprenyltransferase